MDVRYNIIQWVHRYTRGWSYGAAVADPRTGEIIKGNVTLGSLRGRQDYLIAEALLSPYVTGKTITPANDPMLQMVLARIRQLAAHETGHTLGLAHNFAASSFAHSPEQSVSVMDYPHPWITLDANGVPDLSHAYAVNIGQWDKVAIDYGYRQFPAGSRRTRRTQQDPHRLREDRPHLHHRRGRPAPRRRPPARPSLGQRRRSRRRAQSHPHHPRRRAQPLRRERHPHRRAHGAARGHPRPPLSPPPLPDRSHHQGDRRPRLPLPASRRRPAQPHARQPRPSRGRRSTPSSRPSRPAS